MIGLVAATRNGRRHAAHLTRIWPDVRLYDGGKPREALCRAWAECDHIVLFLAAGAAVRLVAPLLVDKRHDPGVVSVDDAARFAVALAGGHAGGANELAGRVAKALGATPVVTTASDALGVPALDSFGERLGFKVEQDSDLAGVGAALVSGETVRLFFDQRWPVGPLPENVVPSGPNELTKQPLISVSDRLAVAPEQGRVVYRPPSLVVGVSCSRGVGVGEIVGLLDATLREAGLARKSVALLASIDVKRDEPGVLAEGESSRVRVRFGG